MNSGDPGKILELLRDPNVECQEVAAAAGVSREDAARAARLVHGIAKAKPEELASLPAILALAVLRAALTAGRADVLSAVAAQGPRDVAKEAKRGLHILKSRGVAVPEPPRQAPVAPPTAPEAPLPCYASIVDGQGERALWIARAAPGKGVEVAQVVVSDVQGVVELQVGMLGRKEFRAFAKDILERGRAVGVGEIDRERAKAIVAAARRQNDASGRPVPEGADVWLSRLGPAAALPDPAEGFPPLPDDEERAALEASGQLHDLPLLRGWLAEEEPLRALASKLDEIAVSPLYIDEQQRADQGARVIAETLDAYFDAPRRLRHASRLFEVAAHLRASGDEAHATLAGAAARALRAGVPPARIPFARLLVEKAFPPPPSAAAPAEPPAEGLILPPR